MKRPEKDFFGKLFSELTSIPTILTNNYFPVLDGLRGIAIIMVVFFHMQLLPGNLFYNVIFAGKLGVNIFFVLSGFLITTLCLKEKIITGDIALKKFYLRRFLRIIPVAYLYILISIVLNKVFHSGTPPLIFVASFLFILDYSNFRNYTNPYTGHYWSLSVEEQFYILFPVLLKKNFKLYFAAVILVVFIVPVMIIIITIFPSLAIAPLYFILHLLIKFQGIATGCLFSVLVFKNQITGIRILQFRYVLNPLLLLAILLLPFNDFFTPTNMLVNLFVSVLIGCFIIINLHPGTDVVYNVLTSKYLRKLGMMSYSIYIWQQIFTVHNGGLPSIFSKFPVNLVFIAIASIASYYLFERYFLKMKKRFSIFGHPGKELNQPTA